LQGDILISYTAKQLQHKDQSSYQDKQLNHPNSAISVICTVMMFR